MVDTNMNEEYIRWTGYNLKEVMKFTGDAFRCGLNTDPWVSGEPRVCMTVYVMIDGKQVRVNVNDLIVKTCHGFEIRRK